MGQVTVFSGPERRRRWSEEERLQILAEAFAPGARVADILPPPWCLVRANLHLAAQIARRRGSAGRQPSRDLADTGIRRSSNR